MSPADSRMFGLDRKPLLPTLLVLLCVLGWSVIMPTIDAAVKQHEVESDTVLDVGMATFVPAPGWVLVQPPSPVGNSTFATVFKDRVTFLMKSGRWKASAAELLDQVTETQTEFITEGPEFEIPLSTGQPGVARRINGPNFTGLLIAYVDGKGNGVEVVVKGPVESSEELAQPIAAMIKSIQFESAEKTS